MEDYIEKVIISQVEEKDFSRKKLLIVIDITKVSICKITKQLVANGYKVR